MLKIAKDGRGEISLSFFSLLFKDTFYLFTYLLLLLLFNFFSFIFISWRLITLQYCSHFYHTFA